jgi:Tfp pilus assembly protein PilZ
MLAQKECRRSERFGRKSIIKLEDDLTLSPYYAVSYNLSDAGMYFKSLFMLSPGAYILIRIDDYAFGPDPVRAKVVWCNELKNETAFNYGVGVEFLQSMNHFGSKTSLATFPRMKTSNDNERGVVIQMEECSAE